MSHYFENSDIDHEILKFNDTLCGYNFSFTTDKGVFSREHVDHLTKIFLDVVIDEINPSKVLDFGCGYGVIGMCVSKYHNCSVDMLDVNKRAVELSKINAKNNDLSLNIFESNMFEEVRDKYSSILLNPPIRAGKKVCYNIYETSYDYLDDNGSLYIVISKKHGAKSTIDYLSEKYSIVSTLYKKKGIYIIKAEK